MIGSVLSVTYIESFDLVIQKRKMIRLSKENLCYIYYIFVVVYFSMDEQLFKIHFHIQIFLLYNIPGQQ